MKIAVYFFCIRLFVWNFATKTIKDMKRKTLNIYTAVFPALIFAVSCEILDNDPGRHANDNDSTFVGLEEVAGILAALPLNSSQLSEVHDAVASSSGNGYDEEYTMKNLFETPGAGVGDGKTKGGNMYDIPLRDMIEDYVRSGCVTRADAAVRNPEKFLEALVESDIQIYWPFSEKWDGETMPIITFDPEDGSEVNIGYKFIDGDDGFRQVEEVVVDEEVAEKVPVWVVNRNSDAGFTSLEMLRREDPEWGEGGGNIVVRPLGQPGTKSEAKMKCLILKDFTAKRNYDSWFAGASEFFVKIGYLDDFTASTEAELRLYNPLVTDFMIVVKRNQVGIPQDFNAVLISRWSENVDAAFMIMEDDGGTKEDWSAKAKVYIAGKSYGVEVSFPISKRDDVVWRGSLAYNWIEKFNGQQSHFGDVDLTFELVDY